MGQKMKKYRVGDQLYSWLAFIDVEYLDDDLCEELTRYDINRNPDQKMVIEKTIVPEFMKLNEISKSSMKSALAEGLACSDQEIEYAFSRVGMPFSEDVRDKRNFLIEIWKSVFNSPVCPVPRPPSE
jgi:hypothetical protein